MQYLFENIHRKCKKIGEMYVDCQVALEKESLYNKSCLWRNRFLEELFAVDLELDAKICRQVLRTCEIVSLHNAIYCSMSFAIAYRII